MRAHPCGASQRIPPAATPRARRLPRPQHAAAARRSGPQQGGAEFDHSRLVGDIYMHLHGVGQAVDVLVVTPEQVEQYRNTHCLIIAPALREGKEVSVSERYAPEDPREWLNRARSHLVLASMQDEGVSLEDLCFNTQQAVEKAIKALLIQCHGNEPNSKLSSQWTIFSPYFPVLQRRSARYPAASG